MAHAVTMMQISTGTQTFPAFCDIKNVIVCQQHFILELRSAAGASEDDKRLVIIEGQLLGEGAFSRVVKVSGVQGRHGAAGRCA